MFVLSALGSTFSGYTHFRVSTDLQNKVVFSGCSLLPFLGFSPEFCALPTCHITQGCFWLLSDLITFTDVVISQL